MTRTRIARAFLLSASLLLMGAVPLCANTMGVSGGHDLDLLWTRAQQEFDLSSLDAVLLLESRHVVIPGDGTVRTTIHRVVRIETAAGIREQADLRIPYDSAASTLTVLRLRTWRDGRWWPDAETIAETAVVETLPFALAQADDYASMRETMLLHDGVELPCIMETAYEIMERNAADGIDGCWVFLQNNPAVMVEFILTIPDGEPLTIRSGNGAPEPAVTIGADRLATYRWTVENADQMGFPPVADPAAHAPYVSWSTWDGWEEIGCSIASTVDDAAVLSGALTDTLAARLKSEPSRAAAARAVAGLVNEWTRSIQYDSRFWQFSPRPAMKTWETAYGHALDRAVLAIALFRAAGLAAEPVFRSLGPNEIDLDVPGLSRFDAMGIVVRGDRFEAFYDPAGGGLTSGASSSIGRTVWYPATSNPPAAPVTSTESDAAGRFELVLTIEPGENDSWKGTGFLDAGGVFCPFGQMAGLGGEAVKSLGKIAGSVLPGATVTRFNPEVFESDRVTAGFELSMPAKKPDDRGRTHITMGNPSGGIMSRLPAGIHLHHETRTSPVYLPGGITQRVRLRVKTGGHEIVYRPEARTITNETGSFSLAVSEENGWLEIDRTLSLKAGPVSPELWPLLRALLLEETDSQNGLILLK